MLTFLFGSTLHAIEAAEGRERLLSVWLRSRARGDREGGMHQPNGRWHDRDCRQPYKPRDARGCRAGCGVARAFPSNNPKTIANVIARGRTKRGRRRHVSRYRTRGIPHVTIVLLRLAMAALRTCQPYQKQKRGKQSLRAEFELQVRALHASPKRHPNSLLHVDRSTKLPSSFTPPAIESLVAAVAALGGVSGTAGPKGTFEAAHIHKPKKHLDTPNRDTWRKGSAAPILDSHSFPLAVEHRATRTTPHMILHVSVLPPDNAARRGEAQL